MDQFDSLKREATKLERSLEDKVSRYQQLVASIPETSATNDLFLAETGMNSSSTSNEDEATLRHDIQRTLTALQDLVKLQLKPAADRLGNQSATLLVKRYREILFDLSGDFEKSRQAHQRKLERAQLMQGARTSLGTGAADDPAMEHLMRERNHIANSQNAAASVINQASEIRSDLRNQGLSLGRVQSTMGMIAGNIPGLNTVMEQIRRKRSKDDKIVAGVIASCILFTLWYLFG
ncbi:SNARE domain anchored protein [Nitzschia inconspicua]|uniref:SNARE domain anchored protein n=1 Tax=Nitzschia inconspicua TaxID=303405 RepID=A0A9K3LBP0_9STRA|nr:SNARE domain anchored protein [Nitzschia inconspicua]KAG7359495.1 SNARE domain anchored protein [Nitzschia inconspicua]